MSLDALPTSVIELVCSGLDDGDEPVNALSVARLSSAYVEPARRRIVRSIRWPYAPDRRAAMMAFFRQHPSYRRLIQRLVVAEPTTVAHLPTPLRIFRFVAGSPGLIDFELNALCGHGAAFHQALEDAMSGMSGGLKLRRLSVLSHEDLHDSEDSKYNHAFGGFGWPGHSLDTFYALIRLCPTTLEYVGFKAVYEISNPTVVKLPVLPALRLLHIDTGDDSAIIQSVLRAASRRDIVLEVSYLQLLWPVKPAEGSKVIEVKQTDSDGTPTGLTSPWEELSKLSNLLYVRDLWLSGVERVAFDLARLPAGLIELSVSIQTLATFKTIGDQLRDGRGPTHLQQLHVRLLLYTIATGIREYTDLDDPTEYTVLPEAIDEAKATAESVRQACEGRGITFSCRLDRHGDL